MAMCVCVCVRVCVCVCIQLLGSSLSKDMVAGVEVAIEVHEALTYSAQVRVTHTHTHTHTHLSDLIKPLGTDTCQVHACTHAGCAQSDVCL